MAEEIVGYVNDKKSVFVTHHPHYRGLVKEVESGHLYLPIVSNAVAELEMKIGVSVLDVRSNIEQIHGDALFTNTFIAGDYFSHLDDPGEIRYGKWIVNQIDPK